MSDEKPEYINTNSGAAPQPGGYAGADGLLLGHGTLPPGYQATEDGIEPLEPEFDDSGLVEPANPVEVALGQQSDGDDGDDGDEPSELQKALDGNMEDVKAYLAAHPDEKDAVIAGEKDGKNRSTLLAELEKDPAPSE